MFNNKCNIDDILSTAVAICPNIKGLDLLSPKLDLIQEITRSIKTPKLKYPSVVALYLSRNKEYILKYFNRNDEQGEIAAKSKCIVQFDLAIEVLKNKNISSKSLLVQLKSPLFIKSICYS